MKWIRVRDKLPEAEEGNIAGNSKSVLVWHNYGPSVATYSKKRGWSDGEGGIYPPEFWAEITPPKGKE